MTDATDVTDETDRPETTRQHDLGPDAHVTEYPSGRLRIIHGEESVVLTPGQADRLRAALGGDA